MTCTFANGKKRNDYENLDENEEEQLGNVDDKGCSVPYYTLYRCATSLDFLCIIIGIICTIIVAICQPIYILLFGRACGYFITYASDISNSSISDEDRGIHAEILRENMYDFAYKTVGVGVLTLVLQYIAGVLLSYSSLRQIFKIRKLFFQSTLNQDISWFDAHQTGDFATTFSENLTKIEEGIGEKVSLCLFYLVAAFSGVAMSLFMGWELTLICIILLPIASLLTAGVSLIGSKHSRQEMESYASAGAVAEEAFSSIRTVLAFDGQQKEVRRYVKHLEEAKRNNIIRNVYNGVSEGVLYFFMYASCAVAAWFSVRLIIEGRELGSTAEQYRPDVIVGIVYITWVSYWNFYLAVPFLRIFGVACGAASKVFMVLDSEPTINASLTHGLKLERCKGEVVFADVHFGYPSRIDVKVLNGINLTIQAGETVAFVGSSGCGKSTCIQLIQRFYDPTQGKIFIDKNDLKDLDLVNWRNHIGVVGQEPSLFATSIAENIRFGKLDATQEQIEKAAKKAQVHDFIESLPYGYDTVIGERGTQLSGGQKQRIAIARALIKEPSVLLLDEATSALDATSEAEVQAAIDSVSGLCTTIIIAHRLSTVRNANRIIVFLEGNIVEHGAYQKLIDTSGVFFNLVKAQAGNGNVLNGYSEKVSDQVPVKELQIEDLKSESGENLTGQQEKGSSVAECSSTRGLLELLKLNKPEWPWIVVGSICSAVIGSSLPLSTMLMANIIGEYFIQNGNVLVSITNPQCGAFLVIGVVAGLAYVLQYYALGIAGENLTLRVRSKMFSTMMNQEMDWFDRKQNAVGALCAKLSSDGAAIQAACGSCVGQIMNSLSILLVSNILALHFQWQLALIMATFIPIIVLATYFESKIIAGNSAQREEMLQKSSAIAVEAIGNIRTVASLGCEEIFLNRYVKELEPYIAASKKQSHLRAFHLGIARVLMSYGYAVGFIYGTRLIIDGGLTYKRITKVVDIQVQGAYAIGQAFAFLPNFQNGIEAAKRIFKVLKRTPAIHNVTNASKEEWEMGDVNFSQVHFSYPTRPQLPVLCGLDLTILAGKTVALVGSSGCGKSTIIQLLERFYNPTEGKISVDDININKMDLKYLRSNFGIVSQEPSLFDRTIAENIAYGDNHKIVTNDEIIEAARSANIHEFISALPLGYETRLGTKGAQLSGGQKQRIAIARALIRNPKVLLLDEATSALDSESEKIVQEALDKAKQNRTCITIAHRLTTIQDADLICVLHAGKIVEMGTHEELLTKGNYYFKFYKLHAGS